MKYELHPACACWPPMSDAEIAELADDIVKNGQLYPAILLDDKMLDGRNRALACEKGGIELRTEVYQGDDPVGFVITANQRRRHLPKVELAFIGDTLATLKHGRSDGRNSKALNSALPLGPTRDQVAKELGIDPRRIDDASSVRKNCEPHIVEMARTGKVGIQAVAAYGRHTPREQQIGADEQMVKKGGYAAIKGGAAKKHGKRPKGPAPVYHLPRPDFSKLDIGDERIPNQPVQLWPAHVQRLLRQAEQVGMVAGQVRLFVVRTIDSAEFAVSAEEFAAGLEQLLAYQPVRGKANGEQTDFAKKARKEIVGLDESLDKAIGWLTAIRDAVSRNRVAEEERQPAIEESN